MSIIDGNQRQQATNPRESFIVQAPAGSGKTEILTQRYLRLLSTVNAPEQIIALTFTKKAASEMRERIVQALQQAHANYQALSPHQQLTLDYATQALKHSEHLHWNLLQQPNRLKVITIDALCQSINQAIPLLEQQIAYAQISNTPQTHYLNAARSSIQYAIDTPQYQPAIKTLLLHVDNKQERLIELFKTLLIQRDQWLSPLFQAKTQKKSAFEKALKLIEQHEITRFKNTIPRTLAQQLIDFARTLANLENNAQTPRYRLKDWYELDEINPGLAEGLCKLILDSKNNLRNGIDHHAGLKKQDCNPKEYEQLKSEGLELLNQLKYYPDFLTSLLQISTLPKPEYEKEQWEVLQALFLLLPMLASQLQVIFTEHNEVDFTATAQQALSALGEADYPTDLALYMDNKIQHLLVDEFQDTSITQFELLSRLVQGWEPEDGRTLFIVGDPMQSIYRFRQAEVGLFFRAQEQGVGPVKLKSLQLCCNFRSTKTLVHWVNTHFSDLFPKQCDIESGAVSYHPSVHVKSGDESCRIEAFQCEDKHQEAQLVIKTLKQELIRNPEQKLAILVRSRSQLTEIIYLLRQNNIPYQGTDIDLLAHLMHLKDVWSLTQALLNPGNRLFWLSMLRSPYCGLTLQDIHAIAQFNKKKSIYTALLQLDKIPGVSEEGRQRAAFFIDVMHQALLQRYQQKLSTWVAQTLNHLHIDSLLNSDQRQDLEQFWLLIDKYEQQGRIPDTQEFIGELNALYSQQSKPSQIHIMTIHKSKGLEFDTVLLPGLGSKQNSSDQPLLRWLKLPTQNQDHLLLVSPIKAAHQDHCSLYEYLSQIDAEKEAYEAQRVLYVAVTRAKSRLYLFDCSSRVSRTSFRSMLKNQEFVSQETDQDLLKTKTCALPELFKLPADYYQNTKNNGYLALNPPGSRLISGISRLTGIVTHQLLQWICDNHPQTLTDIPWTLALYELKKLGFDQRNQELALAAIKQHIAQMLQDETGQWILAEHEQEHNEYQLLVEHQNHLVTRIIDRVFIYQSKLWIIDFKTGKEEPEALQRYQKQLNEYAYYLSKCYTIPIHCGLYFLPNTHWIHWQYDYDAKTCLESQLML